jgi:EAL domain-containing protein (putative c-di-GMP-specific phosphodiesterase class I)
VGALGRAIRELATANCTDMPLFLNVHPNEFDESWLVQPDDPIFTHDQPIYLEVTESVPLSHFAYCHSVLREIRGKGVSLAVDDLGAGYSNLKYIVDLRPEIVKLDRTLIADLADDRRAQVLVQHIVRLCQELGALVVAEGIEQETEMKVVIDCGAHYGQGYYFARPAYPAPGVSATPRAILSKGA